MIILHKAVTRVRQAGQSARAAIPRALSRLLREDGGNVAMMFGLCSMVVVAMVGGAIDVGRAYAVRYKIQGAVDAAALAASSAYVLDPNHDKTAAIEKGLRFFQSITRDVPGVFASIDLDSSTMTAKITAGATIATPFLNIAGVKDYTIRSYAEASASESVSGANGDNDVEIALMLDTTGSMGDSDGNGKTKIQALQDAAKLMIDILIPDTGKAHARVALVPFAATVNLGDAYIEAATGLPESGLACTSTKQVCVKTTCAAYWGNGSCRTWNQDCTAQCTSTAARYLRRCVTERLGEAQFTDAAPGPGDYIPAYIPSSDNDAYTSSLTKARQCTPRQAVVPLTSQKAVLKATIDEFHASGTTAGWLGTAWAWYVLSPEWSGIFTGPNAPRAYGETKLKKIAVLMTDGEYNTASGDSADVAEVSRNAVAVCAGMKAKGIEVYTVGFKLDNATARETLRQCATDENHYFEASNGKELESAFREVAFRSVPVHLAR